MPKTFPRPPAAKMVFSVLTSVLRPKYDRDNHHPPYSPRFKAKPSGSHIEMPLFTLHSNHGPYLYILYSIVNSVPASWRLEKHLEIPSPCFVFIIPSQSQRNLVLARREHFLRTLLA